MPTRFCLSLTAVMLLCLCGTVAAAKEEGQRVFWGQTEQRREEGVNYEQVTGTLQRNPSGNEGVRCWNDCRPDCVVLTDAGRMATGNCSHLYRRSKDELPFGKRVRAIIKHVPSRPVPQGYQGQIAGRNFPAVDLIQEMKLDE